MDRFQLWLHPDHGNGNSGLALLNCPELAAATSASERLACLSMTAAKYASQLEVWLSGLHDLSVSEEAICALDSSGAIIMRMPIALSLIAGDAVGHDLTHAFDGVVGVLAYAPPVHAPEWTKSAGSCYGPGLESISTLWIMVVARTVTLGARGQPEVGPPSGLLLTAMRSLGSWGAICGGTLGYESDCLVGEGGFGNVFRCSSVTGGAEDTLGMEGIQLASKVISATTSEESLVRELACFQAAQKHPNICRYVAATCDFSDVGKPVWNLVMEAHPQGSLTVLVRSAFKSTFTGVNQKRALSISRDMLEGLSHIHAVGLIHRDVKPDNVLISSTDGRTILIDFGISAHTSEDASKRVSGTPGFAAPEVLFRQTHSPKVDVFGTGAVLYFALGGINPFSGRDIKEILQKTVSRRVRFPSRHFFGTSRGARKLIQLMVHPMVDRRPDADAALGLLRLLDDAAEQTMKALLVSSAESESKTEPAIKGHNGDARSVSLDAMPSNMESETAASAPEEASAEPDAEVSMKEEKMKTPQGREEMPEDLISHGGSSERPSLPGSADDTYLFVSQVVSCKERDPAMDDDREGGSLSASHLSDISVKGKRGPRTVSAALSTLFQRKRTAKAKEEDVFMNIVTSRDERESLRPAGGRSSFPASAALAMLRGFTRVSYIKQR